MDDIEILFDKRLITKKGFDEHLSLFSRPEDKAYNPIDYDIRELSVPNSVEWRTSYSGIPLFFTHR